MTGGALPEHVRALLAPGVLVSPDVAPTLVQTHISFVVLAGDRVYKLKKPRDFGFLDYSTLALRRSACEAEVTLNRRLTRGVYLGVASVTRSDGRYRIDGEGEVVDHAVVMRRLPADRMMDRLVERDAVPAALLDRLARRLASFYAGAATGGRIDGFAAAPALLANWQENFLQTLPFAGRALSAAAYLHVARAVYRDIMRLRPLWQERIDGRHARDCHGDLRLNSVCFDDGIQVYDCIEFNERFRYGDVAADIAFLTMDLDGHGRPDLADELLASFVAVTGDTTLPAVLPFYRCYRAYVRGKVDAFQLDEPEVPAVQRRAARAAARRRFALARWYTRPPRARLAVVSGPAPFRDGVAAALAGRLGAVLIGVADNDPLAAAGRRLRVRIPVVMAADRLDGDLWARLCTLGGQYRVRPLAVACGPAAAPPDAVVLPHAMPLRTLLRELHLRLRLAPPSREAPPAGDARTARSGPGRR